MQQFFDKRELQKVQDYFCTLTGLYEMQGYYFVRFPAGENYEGKYAK